jgi:exosome complex component CSL4
MERIAALRYEVGSVVAPGDRLGSALEYQPGSGVYAKGGHVYASLVGRIRVKQQQQLPEQPVKAIVAVEPLPGKLLAASQVLSVGQLVVGRVVRIELRQALIEIGAAENAGVLRVTQEGAIRREDARTGATEQIQIEHCFQPGDLVLCRILSLGDSRRYSLSTSDPELGVIRAYSASSRKVMMVRNKNG